MSRILKLVSASNEFSRKNEDFVLAALGASGGSQGGNKRNHDDFWVGGVGKNVQPIDLSRSDRSERSF